VTAEQRLDALITGAVYENMSAGQYGEFAVLAADAIKLLRRLRALRPTEADLKLFAEVDKWLDGAP